MARRWLAGLASGFVAFGLVACGGSGSLDPGGLDGGYVSASVRSPDGRPSVFATAVANRSQTESARLVSVELINANGLELVEAYTFDMDHQIPMGGRIPPLEGDSEPPPGVDFLANWETRVPLAESVIAPDEYRWMVLAVRALSEDDCVYAEGFKLTYRQHGRTYRVVSDGAPMIYYLDPETGDDQCDAIADQIFEKQRKRRGG